MKGTAIVELRPVRQVGLAHAGSSSLPGAIPCVFERTFWESLQNNSSVFGVMNAHGEILIQDRKVGQFGATATYVGEEIHEAIPVNETEFHLNGYVPIYQQIGNDDRVVGFGSVDIQGTGSHVAITMQTSIRQSLNASTFVTGDLSEINKEELIELFSINQTLKNAILAPTLTS